MKSFCMKLTVFVVMGSGLGTLHAQMASDRPAVLKLDPALDDLISTDAKLEKVKGDYFQFIEGPTWGAAGKKQRILALQRDVRE